MEAVNQIFGPDNSAQTLGQQIGSGGEGTVYQVLRFPKVVVKCYHDEVLFKHRARLEQKITAMIGLKDQLIQKVGKDAFSWPAFSVYNDKHQWIGYAMKKVAGVPMSRLAHPKLCQKKFPKLDRVALVSYLIRYLEAVDALHQTNVLIGDYNLNNAMCLPGSDQVSLIDCDSYQAVVNNQFHACCVGSPDMTPPEHHNKDFSKVRRTEASENFSIAIMLFKCLMLGRHPYDIVGGEDPVHNLRSGKFAYGKGNTGIPNGPWYNIWSHMPFNLKSMFIETFTEGSNAPNKRPGISDWQHALNLYRNEMQKEWHAREIMPIAPKPNVRRGGNSVSQFNS